MSDKAVFVLKNLCTYILLLALTAQSLHTGILVVEYRVHLAQYLAKCANRDRPELHCDGQCLLMQKVREKEENEAQKNLTAPEYNTFYEHQECTVFGLCPPDGQSIGKPFPPCLTGYGFDYNHSVFRPPIA